jgi:glucose-1-phosphate thymidylyltransferase
METKNKVKGVILAAGRGTRLRPLTEVANKILLPVFDRPMIAGPIETLRNMGVSDICVVTSKEHLPGFIMFLGNGSAFGVKFTYVIQDKPLGIAHALLQAEDFCDGNKTVVILGDNIFETVRVPKSALRDRNAYVFLKAVKDPQRFGVAELDRKGNVIGIEEKPQKPKTNYIVPGLYIYPSDVFGFIKRMKPSARGEYEITEVNNYYIRKANMKALEVTGYWLDTGTFDSLLKAALLRAMHVDSDALKGVDKKSLKRALTKV